MFIACQRIVWQKSRYRRALATHNPPPQAALPFLPPRLSFRRNLSTLRVHLVFIPRRVNRFFQNDKRGGRKRGVGKIPDLCTAHARQYRGRARMSGHLFYYQYLTSTRSVRFALFRRCWRCANNASPSGELLARRQQRQPFPVKPYLI